MPQTSATTKAIRYLTHPRWIVERASRFRQIQTNDLVWIFGVGRSGSTWLTELLDGLHATRVWHEPYFGNALSRLAAVPEEASRKDFFFSDDYADVWQKGLRSMFLSSARARFGRINPGTRIVIKDINATQVCPVFADVFPDSKYLLLVRDPYDVLDSSIDMKKPGSWGAERKPVPVEELAHRIKSTLEMALQGYERVQEDRRLKIRYCDILEDPEAQVKRCINFLALPADDWEIQETIEEHDFGRHSEKGPGAFRRFGKAGIWRESGNFTPNVEKIAEKYLGQLRHDLGYHRN